MMLAEVIFVSSELAHIRQKTNRETWCYHHVINNVLPFPI